MLLFQRLSLFYFSSSLYLIVICVSFERGTSDTPLNPPLLYHGREGCMASLMEEEVNKFDAMHPERKRPIGVIRRECNVSDTSMPSTDDLLAFLRDLD